MSLYLYALKFNTVSHCGAREKGTFFFESRFYEIVLSPDDGLLTNVLLFYLYADM
jgi:hypothetical protein